MNDRLIRNKESAKNLEDMYENKIVKLLDDKKNLSKQFDEMNQSVQGEGNILMAVIKVYLI